MLLNFFCSLLEGSQIVIILLYTGASGGLPLLLTSIFRLASMRLNYLHISFFFETDPITCMYGLLMYLIFNRTQCTAGLTSVGRLHYMCIFNYELLRFSGLSSDTKHLCRMHANGSFSIIILEIGN